MYHKNGKNNLGAVVFLLFLASLIGLIFCHKTIILSLARKSLLETFPGSRVAIENCHFEPAHLLVFQNVSIAKEKTYAVGIKEIRIEYTLATLINRYLDKVSVIGLVVNITTPHESVRAFGRHLTRKPSGLLSIKKVGISDSLVSLRSKDLRLEAGIVLDVDLTRPRLERFVLTLDSLTSGDLSINRAYCSGALERAGKIFIKQIRFNKVKVEDVSSTLLLGDSTVTIEHASARLFGGRLTGDAAVNLGELTYTVDLHFSALDAQIITKDFELEEKFKMSGRWAGSLAAAGRGAKITFFDSNLGAIAPGGNLEIVDKKFLEDMATRTQTPTDILVERFRDYHYNKGVVDLSLEGSDLVTGIILDGEKGKSNFKIQLHDFLKTLLSYASNETYDF